jgi:hypothetical protein
VKRRYYITMTRRQAEAAFAEHVTERPVALARLRSELAADGADARALLDCTPESLTPLWRWFVGRVSSVEDAAVPFDADAPGPPWWPAWARHGSVRLSTPDIVVTLMDGLVTYVEDVILRGAPAASRALCTHPIKRYYAQHQPGIGSPTKDVALAVAHVVSAHAGGLRRLGVTPRDTVLTEYARAAIEALEKQPDAPHEAVAEPLLEVTLEDGEFDVSVREDLAHEHSRKLDRMVRELRAQPGVRSAHREDREVLVVRAPDWSVGDLEGWLTTWIEQHIALDS